MSDLIRLMELAGMKDAARSNKKLNELGLPKMVGGHGILSKNSGDNFVTLNNGGSNFLGTEITSRVTGNVYQLSAEPYGMSASRGADDSKIFVSIDVTKLKNSKNEDFNGLSALACNILSQWVNKNQPNELDAQPPRNAFVAPVMKQLASICDKYNAQKGA